MEKKSKEWPKEWPTAFDLYIEPYDWPWSYKESARISWLLAEYAGLLKQQKEKDDKKD